MSLLTGHLIRYIAVLIQVREEQFRLLHIHVLMHIFTASHSTGIEATNCRH